MEDINFEVGFRIRTARKKLKMSMKELGKALNLHESTISRYEKGEIQNLTIEKLKEFAKVLNVSVLYLMGWDDLEQITKNKERYKKEVGNPIFTDYEMTQIINYCNYILSLRDKKEIQP